MNITSACPHRSRRRASHVGSAWKLPKSRKVICGKTNLAAAPFETEDSKAAINPSCSPHCRPLGGSAASRTTPDRKASEKIRSPWIWNVHGGGPLEIPLNNAPRYATSRRVPPTDPRASLLRSLKVPAGFGREMHPLDGDRGQRCLISYHGGVHMTPSVRLVRCVHLHAAKTACRDASRTRGAYGSTPRCVQHFAFPRCFCDASLEEVEDTPKAREGI